MSATTLERPAALLPPAVLTQVGTAGGAAPCTAERHADSQHAWRHGCRCPGAEAAHNAYQDGQRAARLARHGRIIETPDPDCTANTHRASDYAWRKGCRCTDAKLAHRREVDRRRERAAEARTPAAASAAELAANDPRKPWRGPDMRVSWNNLLLLTGGFVDSPTTMERTVACLRLLGRGMDKAAVAERLRICDDTVDKARARVVRLREERTERRLADARWRVMRNEWLAGQRHSDTECGSVRS